MKKIKIKFIRRDTFTINKNSLINGRVYTQETFIIWWVEIHKIHFTINYIHCHCFSSWFFISLTDPCPSFEGKFWLCARLLAGLCRFLWRGRTGQGPGREQDGRGAKSGGCPGNRPTPVTEHHSISSSWVSFWMCGRRGGGIYCIALYKCVLKKISTTTPYPLFLSL